MTGFGVRGEFHTADSQAQWDWEAHALGWLRAELRPLSVHMCPVDMHLYGCTPHKACV